MAVFRVEKNQGYTVMSNHHLRNSSLSLKAKGLLSQMLSLPENWDFTLAGLASINREGEDSIGAAVKELESAGYIRRQRLQGEGGKFSGIEYVIYEQPIDASPLPENPEVDNPDVEKPVPENPGQLNKDISSKDISKRKNKKEKPKRGEFTLEEMKPMFAAWVHRVDPGRDCPDLFPLLVEFYSPRAIKKGGPPMKTERGLNGLFGKLERETNGVPAQMEKALDEAIEKGWSSVHPKPAGGGAPPPAEPREKKRWL